MPTNGSRTGYWTDDVWASIDDGVKTAMGSIRVAQMIFPTEQLADVTSIPAGIFIPDEMRIEEGETRPYVELAVDFPLSNGQVNAEPSGKTAIALAKFAARSLALAEDIIILQGRDGALPPNVTIESGENSLKHGLVGLAPQPPIQVSAPDSRVPTNSGAMILSAVRKGLAVLEANGQAREFALIADPAAHAEIGGTVLNGVPTISHLEKDVLRGGIVYTRAMPENTALLVALGGDPTTIFFSDEPMTEPTYKGESGRFHFRSYERIQCIVRDERAFVMLDFSYLPSIGGAAAPAAAAPAAAAPAAMAPELDTGPRRNPRAGR